MTTRTRTHLSARRATSAAGAALLGAAMLLGGASPASAAYDGLRVPPGSMGVAGGAEADVNYGFTGASRMYVDVDIRDLCPADGYGAYLDMHVSFIDGSSRVIRVGQDANGCGGWKEAWTDVNPAKRIRDVWFHLFTYDQDRGVYGPGTSTGFRDNPYT